ncbi:MAG: Ig-like domain-containing protein [Verrucomicrobiota bacterium]
MVNAFSTWSSSDTNIVTVDANGYVTAVATGSAKIIASYNGFSATNTITVTAPPATSLVHRYSFNEEGGTTVADSVGGANGVLLATARRLALARSTCRVQLPQH